MNKEGIKMNGIYYNQYKDYVESYHQGRKLVLFGAGRRAFEIIYDYYLNEEISFICDNSTEKQGGSILNIPICTPEKLRENPDGYVVLITVMEAFAVKRISQQLEEMKIRHYYPAAILDFVNMIERYDTDGNKKYHEFHTFQVIQDNMDKLLQVREMLCDQKSVEVFDAYIEKVQYNVKNYDDIADNLYEHYFSDNIFRYSDQEYFVDGGAYDGDDSIWFAEQLKQEGKHLEKAYCFEPDGGNFSRTCTNFQKYFGVEISGNGDMAHCGHMTVYRSGLYDKDDRADFIAYGMHCSRFEENGYGADKIPTMRLDSVIGDEKVTFIKFDLEGADIPAIVGASETIRKNKPKLALSIYHDIEDLWEIPLMIKELVPEYKLFVRHHTKFEWDKVLYAALDRDLK